MAPHTEKTERIRSGVAKKIATKSIIEKTVLIQAVDLKQRTPIPVKKKKQKQKQRHLLLNIARQCLHLSKSMAEKNQPGISQKIKALCDEYSSRWMILNENNGKTLISSVAQNLSKALINHQLLILASKRKLISNRTEFLDAIKNPLHRSAINKFLLGNHRDREIHCTQDSRISKILFRMSSHWSWKWMSSYVFLHSIWYALPHFFWWNHYQI